MLVGTVAFLNPDCRSFGLKSDICVSSGGFSAVQSQADKRGWRRSCPEVTGKVKQTDLSWGWRGKPEAPNDRGQSWLSKPLTLSEPSGDASSCWLTTCLTEDTQGVKFGSSDIWVSWPRVQLNFISVYLHKEFLPLSSHEKPIQSKNNKDYWTFLPFFLSNSVVYMVTLKYNHVVSCPFPSSSLLKATQIAPGTSTVCHLFKIKGHFL